MGIPRILQTTEKFLTSNSPQVLTVLGVAGVITTAVLTGKASFRAAEIIQAGDYYDPYPTREKIKQVWKLYIPPISVAAVTVTSIIMANRIGTRRAAALAAAYTLSERAFDEYRDKVKEKFGDRKEREVRDEVAADRVNRSNAPVQVVIPGALDVLCYDEMSDRFFQSTMEKIKKAENDLNWQLIHYDSASLNEYYSRVGLDPVHYGERIGWNAFRKLELGTTSVLRGDGVPAISIHFSYDPEPNYDSLH